MKLRPSHYIIAKLVLGHLDEYSQSKNVNLASSPQWGKILEIQRNAAKKRLEETMATEVFEGEEDKEDQKDDNEDEEENIDSRKWMQALKALGETFTVELNGVRVKMLTPKNWRTDTNCVKLEKESLEGFCKFLLMDVEDCFGQQKRKYTKRKKPS